MKYYLPNALRGLLICFFLTLFSAECVWAQVQLEGSVVQDSLNKPLPDVNVMIYRADSLVAVMLTNQRGQFKLSLDSGRYAMSVGYMGYVTHEENFVLPAKGLKLSPVRLVKSTTMLQEMVVDAERDRYEMVQNRMVYTIPERDRKSAVNLYSFFLNIPALRTELIDKSVEIIGVDNSIVLVDNIVRNKEYLMMLKPENIDKIEIIHYPSARYTSRGIGGVINVVTKKMPFFGKNAYVSANLNPEMEFVALDGAYSWVAPKAAITLSTGGFYIDEYKYFAHSIRETEQNGQIIRTESYKNKAPKTIYSPFVGATLNITPNAKSYTSLELQYFLYNSNSNTYGSGTQYVDREKSFDFDTYQENDGNDNSGKVKLYHQTEFNKITTMSIDGNYQLKSNDKYTYYLEKKTEMDNYSTGQTNNSLEHYVDGQINFEHKFKKVTLEEGYRFFWKKSTFDDVRNDKINRSIYEDIRNNIYMNILGDLNKRFTYQLGLCFDLVNRKVNDNSQLFPEFVPRAMISYKINNQQKLTFDYTRGRSIPSFAQMNPLIISSDSSYAFMGNPDLKPAFRNMIRLRYWLTHNKLYIFTALTYSFTKGPISSVQKLTDNGVYLTTMVNADWVYVPGFLIVASYKVFPWWELGIYGNIVYETIKDKHEEQLNRDRWMPYLSITSKINYKRFSAYFGWDIAFRLKTYTGYSRSRAQNMFNCTYRINDAWSLMASIRSFTPIFSESESCTPGYYEYMYTSMKDRSMQATVGAQYNFFKGRQQSYKNKKVKIYDY